VNQNALLGIEEETTAAPVQAQEVCTVTTRKGAEVIQTQVECPK
jgi:pilus assembly protein CpaB